jgi:hypothetical protein
MTSTRSTRLLRRLTPRQSHPAKPSGRVEATANQGTSWFARLGPIGLVIAPIVLSAIELRSEITYVTRLNDSAFHSEMVRYATAQFQAGHFPLDGWFPSLSLGSPVFLHYQSLGAMLTGLLGTVIGANRAFSLTLYLLVVGWPIAVYLAGRVFGWSRWESAFAALVASFVVSATGVGYEQIAYLWKGYGVWTQAWAMWTLPFAWAFSWRAIDEGRNYLPAALFIALTTALHFETGYLAFIPVLLWVLVRPSRLVERVKRAVVVGAGGFCLVAWAIVPLVIYRGWASIDEFLQQGPDVRSYGARRILSWLFTGQIFDHGRIPVITILAAIGFVACLVRWRRDTKGRALVLVFLVSLLLFFGPVTWHSLYHLLPGSSDIFTRRFIIGVQLSGIFFAGIGAVVLGQLALTGTRLVFQGGIEKWLAPGWRPVVGWILVFGLTVGATAPMWTEIVNTDSADASLIATQRDYSREQSEVDTLVGAVNRIGGGRVYAGMSFWGWGSRFHVGWVPVAEYLSVDQVDEIGFTNRTASLMSDPEAYFDDRIPADYALFGVRFVILPAGHKAPPGAQFLQQAGPYQLWELRHNGYFQVVDTYGPPLHETKSHMGADSASFVRSSLAGEHLYPVVAFGSRAAAAPTLAPGESHRTVPGSVVGDTEDLAEGQAAAVVQVRRTSVVLLKVTFDPGWTVTVDGRPAPTEMIAPAFVGVRVGPGRHVVVFSYQGFSYYPELFVLALLALLALGCGPWLWARREQLIGAIGGAFGKRAGDVKAG